MALQIHRLAVGRACVFTEIRERLDVDLAFDVAQHFIDRRGRNRIGEVESELGKPLRILFGSSTEDAGQFASTTDRRFTIPVRGLAVVLQ